MLDEMGVKQPLLLNPGCPPSDDSGISTVLDLAAAVLPADWVELVLTPDADNPGRTYSRGKAAARGSTRELAIDDEFTARLRYGGTAKPSDEVLRALAAALQIALDRHRLRSQTAVLRSALDSTSNPVLLFDCHGDILYANPPADHLLSLQTEDELLVETEDGVSAPLFTVLSNVVEQVVPSGPGSSAWQGTLQARDGRVLACEVTRLPQVGALHDTILVLLQYLGSEPAARIESFCSTHNLSPREIEVVQLLIEGLTTVAMAERLSISPHTVRDHLKNLYRKTGASSRGELLGLVSRAAPATIDRYNG
jgi:DNA-binding CsgD family transcriptional regulator